MRHKKTKRRVEWDVVITIGFLLLIWLFGGMPALNGIAEQHNSFVAFSIYLAVVCVLGFVIGNTFKKGLESAVVSLSLMLLTDIIFPPMVISFAEAPSQEILNLWGSDTFMYLIWAALGLGHQVTWILTYFLSPMIGVLLLVYFLSGKRLKNSLMVMLNGG